MVLCDFRISFMRVFVLFSHILFTTFLYWTKIDQIQVTLPPPSLLANAQYKADDISYTGFLSVGLIFLFIEVFYLGFEVQITIWSCLHLFLDFCANLFLVWIILDGLTWTSYIYIFVFCV